MRQDGIRNLVLALALGCASAAGIAQDKWTCKAEGLVTARYDGSGWAYIHLNGFQTGGQYRVKLNDAKTEATGTTQNGTPFTCTKG